MTGHESETGDSLWLQEEKLRYQRITDEKAGEFRRQVQEHCDWIDGYVADLLGGKVKTNLTNLLKTPGTVRKRKAPELAPSEECTDTVRKVTATTTTETAAVSEPLAQQLPAESPTVRQGAAGNSKGKEPLALGKNQSDTDKTRRKDPEPQKIASSEEDKLAEYMNEIRAKIMNAKPVKKLELPKNLIASLKQQPIKRMQDSTIADTTFQSANQTFNTTMNTTINQTTMLTEDTSMIRDEWSIQSGIGAAQPLEPSPKRLKTQLKSAETELKPYAVTKISDLCNDNTSAFKSDAATVDRFASQEERLRNIFAKGSERLKNALGEAAHVDITTETNVEDSIMTTADETTVVEDFNPETPLTAVKVKKPSRFIIDRAPADESILNAGPETGHSDTSFFIAPAFSHPSAMHKDTMDQSGSDHSLKTTNDQEVENSFMIIGGGSTAHAGDLIRSSCILPEMASYRISELPDSTIAGVPPIQSQDVTTKSREENKVGVTSKLPQPKTVVKPSVSKPITTTIAADATSKKKLEDEKAKRYDNLLEQRRREANVERQKRLEKQERGLQPASQKPAPSFKVPLSKNVVENTSKPIAPPVENSANTKNLVASVEITKKSSLGSSSSANVSGSADSSSDTSATRAPVKTAHKITVTNLTSQNKTIAGKTMKPNVVNTLSSVSIQTPKRVLSYHHLPLPSPDPSQTILDKGAGGDYIIPEVPSDDESSDDEEATECRRGQKPAPEWAQPSSVLAALDQQRTLNPDRIFGEFKPPRLEDIFKGQAIKKFRPRGSSANWSKDRLTAQETENYAKVMGFAVPAPPKRNCQTSLLQQKNMDEAEDLMRRESAPILTKKKIRELVEQIDPNERLDADVEAVLLELADDFIYSVTKNACQLAKHRQSDTLEVKDIQLHLETAYNIRIPGFSAEDVRIAKKHAVPQAHQQKLNHVRKAMNADMVEKERERQRERR